VLLRVATALLAVSLLVPGTSEAQGPGGATPGVRVHVGERKVSFSFAATAGKAFRGIAGREVTVRCTRLGASGGLTRVDQAESSTARAPRKRAPVRVTLPSRRYGYCELQRTDGRRAPLAAAVTARGATVLDERAAAGRLLTTIILATSVAPSAGTWPPAAQVVGVSEGTVVALAAATDSPPAGKVGYFSDGAGHMAVVALSSAGRRLFIDLNGDVTATNVLEYLGSS
jgi:hypothetical protein